MARWLDTLRERLEASTGKTTIESDRLLQLQEAARDAGLMQKELDLMGWTALNYVAGQPQELKPEHRRQWSQKARVAWMNDPMAGAAVELLNNFTFGRGVPRPAAKDDEVQKVIDEFWDDPDNEDVLTSFEAQMAVGTDMQLQSNLFVAVYDDGDDGKVKTGIVQHDTIFDVVRDPNKYTRICYFVAGEPEAAEWDFDEDRPATQPLTDLANLKKVYYENWRLKEYEDEAKKAATKPGGKELPKAPATKVKPGRIIHLRQNRTTEMAFGVPTMQRTLRWYNAFNRFMDARVDMATAAAALLMKRKIKGTPQQVTQMAMKAMTTRSPIGVGAYGDTAMQAAPAAASIVTENENLTHEQVKLDSGAGNASEDALLLRGQISAATGFPQHYLGDHGNANLATATSMELPVAKHVEAFQEMFEGMYRKLIDLAIDRAVEAGRLSKELTPAERQSRLEERKRLGEAPNVEDEEDTGRDLSYEFSMPNPLRRMMTDLVTAVSNIAKTFDPNNTNVELSRTLLGIVLGEGLEVQDPASIVDRIFPPGYVDPAIAAAQDAQQQPFFEVAPREEPAPEDEEQPYGLPSGEPEQYAMQQGAVIVTDRFGRQRHVPYWRRVVEAAALPDNARRHVARRQDSTVDAFEAEVMARAEELLAAESGNGSNGHGAG